MARTIGIDLGTTNSAVAYVDTRAADPRVRVFEVPQLVAPGEVAPRRQPGQSRCVYRLRPSEWRPDAPHRPSRASRYCDGRG